MIFNYVSYELAATPTIPSGEIHRPLIPIRIIGPAGTVRILGLIDTGADHVFISASLANRIGIDISGVSEKVLAAGGHEAEVWPGAIEIEVVHGHESCRWRATVGFILGDDDPPLAYLGHAGFLECFTATFDGERQSVELRPNDRLRHA